MKRKRRHDLTLTAKVGARMQDWRLAKGLSLVQLHARGAPTPSQLSLIERGIVDVTVKTICDVARALRVRPWQLLCDEPDLARLTFGEARRILFVHPEWKGQR
jgi:transcriptional regulator with XRE-family HTH domain